MKPFKQKVRMSLAEIQRNEATIRSIAGGFGMALRVLNQGQHWEFKRPGLLVDWWPSSGSTMVNKTGGRRTPVYTLEDLRPVLAQGVAKAPARRTPKKNPFPAAADLKPDAFRKCENCDNFGAIPFSGLCGPCTYGTAEALEW